MSRRRAPKITSPGPAAVLNVANPSPTWLPYALIFSAAFSVRAIHLVAMRRSYPLFNFFIGDAAGYNDWAKRIAGGDWVGQGIFYQDPLYPYALALLYRVFGYSPVLVRWIQIFLGSLNCLVIYEIARRLWDRRIALFAGWISVFYGLFIFYEGALLKEGLSVFLSSLALLTAIAAQQNPSKAKWFLSGIVLGLLVLTRGNAFLLVPIVLAAIAIKSGNVERWTMRVGYAFAFLSGFLGILTPSAVRNYRVGHDWVLTTSQAGSNFYIGNNPAADGTYVPLVAGRQTPEYEGADARRIAELDRGRSLKPSEVSTFWFHKSFQYITESPSAWLELLWIKTRMFFWGYELPDVEDYYLARRFSPILRLPLVLYALLCPVALLGMLYTIKRWRSLFLLYGFAIGNAVSVILFYVFARYRLPSVPPFIVFAGIGLSAIVDAVKKRLVGQAVGWGLVLAGLFWFVNEQPYPSLATSLCNLGTTYRELGQPDKAVAILNEALQVAPQDPNPHFILGNLYMASGKPDQAITEYLNVLRYDPHQTEAMYLLGVIYFNRKDYPAARAQWEHVLAIVPSHPEAQKALRLLPRN